VRLRRLEEEYGDQIELEWRSFLLRPERRTHADPAAALEKFRAYTQSWLRPAAEPDGGDFQVWQSDEGPPSHSVPAHLVSKAAQRLGREAFEKIHDRLLRAYFKENRDISRMDVLLEMWLEVGLPEDAFEVASEPALLDEGIRDHREALESGATGVPAMQLAGNPAMIVGAHPIDLYRRWVDRTLERRAAEAEAG
jgi:predicted DsbA family dithiol-disulfide isomerase